MASERPQLRAASAWVRPCLVMAVMTSLALDTGEHDGPVLQMS
ncbi:MAG: hypothetical protein V9F00_17910 [Nocardioides sp.]